MRHSNAVQAGTMHGVLVELLSWLDRQDYDFVTVTPETHRRVLARRPGAIARDLRDVFGWSLPFWPSLLPEELLRELTGLGLVEQRNEACRSRLRASSVHGRLFLHSAYPTDAPDAVFLGPDSYRFANLIAQEPGGAGRCLDIGAGAGVGGILARAARTVLTDINPFALTLARANADFARVEVEPRLTADARSIPGAFDLILANPPFIDDPERLTYRHGGRLGIETALDWTQQALAKLAPGGVFLLYSGTPVIGGEDQLRGPLERLCQTYAATLAYSEIDPDIFGEQLEAAEYRNVERIAAVAARIGRG